MTAPTRPAGTTLAPVDGSPSRAQAVLRTALGVALLGAGTGHLTTQREEFRAQVPRWVPLSEDFVVVASGVVEIGLGTALVALLFRPFAPRRVLVGLVVAAFFVAIFPGNIAQWLEKKDGFGLDTDAKRFGRLFFQPVLIAWALWSTGAWHWLRAQRRADR